MKRYPLINPTFTIAEMGFSTLYGHFDLELGTLRFAVATWDGVNEELEHFDDYKAAKDYFNELTTAEVL